MLKSKGRAIPIYPSIKDGQNLAIFVSINCIFDRYPSLVIFTYGFLSASCVYKLDDSGSRYVSCVQHYVDSDRLSVGTVAGAVFGCLAFIGLVVLAVTIFCWWKKGRQSGTQRTIASTSASKYAVRSNQAGAHPTNPAQPQIIVTNTETQQNYPMTSKDGAYTMRMHTGYDQ